MKSEFLLTGRFWNCCPKEALFPISECNSPHKVVMRIEEEDKVFIYCSILGRKGNTDVTIRQHEWEEWDVMKG